MKKHKSKPHGMRIEPRANPMTLHADKRVGEKPAKAGAHDVASKDNAFDRNFTKAGTPRLSATSGEGSMGQRR